MKGREEKKVKVKKGRRRSSERGRRSVGSKKGRLLRKVLRLKGEKEQKGWGVKVLREEKKKSEEVVEKEGRGRKREKKRKVSEG